MASEELRDVRERAYDLFGELLAEQEAAELLASLEEEGAPEESDAFLKRCDERSLRVIDGHVRRERTKRLFFQTLPHLARAAAILIAVITLAGCTAYAASGTVRAYVYQLLIQPTEEYTRLSLVPSETDFIDVPEGWDGLYYPAYIPEGLTLIQADWGFADYGSGDSPRPLLSFNELDEGGVIQIDTEGAEVRAIQIHGQPAHISVKGTHIHVFWSEGARYFVVSTRDMAEEVAIRIAESVTLIR